MNQIKCFVGIAAFCAILNVWPTRAEIFDVDKFYISYDTGVVLQQPTTLSVSLNGTPYVLENSVTFHPGVRGDIAFGYQFIPSLALELETGLLWTSSAKILQQGYFTTQYIDLYQVPILGNLVYQIPITDHLKAYAGAGAGVVLGTANYGVFPLPESTSFNATFAYQAEAGLKYCLTDHLALGLGYKFFGTLGQEWNNTGETIFNGPVQVKLNNIYTHSIMANITWTF